MVQEEVEAECVEEVQERGKKLVVDLRKSLFRSQKMQRGVLRREERGRVEKLCLACLDKGD